MNRPLILGSVGTVIVAAAIVLTFYVDREAPKDVAAVLTGSAPVADVPATSRARSNASLPPVMRPNPIQGAPDPAASGTVSSPPSFDVVRVNPRGDAVIAGRAAPNADVTVRDGGKEVGRAKADARGEWVVVPKKPLAKGSRELTLSATSKNGETTRSEKNVVVLVPGQKNPSAKNGGKQAVGALAVLVPRDGKGESIVVQRPGDAVVATNPSSPHSIDAKPGTVPLSIDAVDYDDSGNVTISGRATPDARLHVYLDNSLAGAGKADRLGRWRLVPGNKLAPGLYRFRVDQVSPKGAVVGRVETRFARSKPAGAVPSSAVVFVEPGNSLWRIARRVYGKGVQYSVIFAANREQIRDPDLIYPGQVFFVPHVN